MLLPLQGAIPNIHRPRALPWAGCLLSFQTVTSQKLYRTPIIEGQQVIPIPRLVIFSRHENKFSRHKNEFSRHKNEFSRHKNEFSRHENFCRVAVLLSLPFYLNSLLFYLYSFIFTLPKTFCPSISYTKLGSSYNENVNFCILRVESLILHYKSSSRILITSKPINLKTSNLNDKLEQLIALFEKEYGCKPIIYLGSFCCWKVIPTVYDCPIWLRFLKVY